MGLLRHGGRSQEFFCQGQQYRISALNLKSGGKLAIKDRGHRVCTLYAPCDFAQRRFLNNQCC